MPQMYHQYEFWGVHKVLFAVARGGGRWAAAI